MPFGVRYLCESVPVKVDDVNVAGSIALGVESDPITIWRPDRPPGTVLTFGMRDLYDFEHLGRRLPCGCRRGWSCG